MSIRWSPLLKMIAVCGVVLAQETPNTAEFSVNVKRVILYATVREGKARFVGNLEKQHFTILEDGTPQEIISFSRDDVPVAIGLLVDNSQSMMNKRNEVVAAAKAFVRASNPNDEMFILHFNEQLVYGLPEGTHFTGDQKLLEEALDKVKLDGRTALYDGIAEGLKRLSESKLTKKALVVISDGGDNMSLLKDSDVVRQADLSGALFYGIGIYDPMDGDAKPGVLRKLGQDTGGEAYFPKEIDEVKGLCEGIARDLRSQYMLSYAPTERAGARDYRKIQVRVKDPERRKLTVRTRTGYYASQEKGMKP